MPVLKIVYQAMIGMLRLSIGEMRAHRLLVLVAMLFGALTLFVLEVIFAPIAWATNLYQVERLRVTLPAATERWQGKDMADYDVDVEAWLPFCPFSVTLNVRAGELASVIEHSAPFRDSGLCLAHTEYSNFTISAVHARLAAKLAELDPSTDALRAEFEPSYGFVTFYRERCHFREGVGDCVTEVRFSNFRPIVANSPPEP